MKIKKEHIFIGFVILALTILLVFLGQKLINRFISIENRLVPFMKRWEGGLSRKTTDTASNNPSPYEHNGVKGWHTNMGVTWGTFESNASRLGYTVNKQNFIHMSDKIWYTIMKGAYMEAYDLDKISDLPRIQAVIITWSWGSGTGGSETRLARFIRENWDIDDSNISKEEIIDIFSKKISPLNEKIWFDKLNDQRQRDFKAMNQPANYNGWINRLNDFRKTFA